MTDPRHNPDSPADPDADEALDRALRERPVDESDDVEFVDEADADHDGSGEYPLADHDGSGEYAVAQPDQGEESPPSGDGADDGEDYVLYSEVRPHLEELVVLQEQRGKMIDLLLYARDRVSSPAVASRMDDQLGQLGITVLVPSPGDRFDPAQHEASATVATDDSTAYGLIAEVEQAGYSDGDRLVRVPIVTVYAAERELS